MKDMGSTCLGANGTNAFGMEKQRFSVDVLKSHSTMRGDNGTTKKNFFFINYYEEKLFFIVKIVAKK